MSRVKDTTGSTTGYTAMNSGFRDGTFLYEDESGRQREFDCRKQLNYDCDEQAI